MRKEGGKVNYMHMIPTECMFSRALVRLVCFKTGKIKKAVRDGSISDFKVKTILD